MKNKNNNTGNILKAGIALGIALMFLTPVAYLSSYENNQGLVVSAAPLQSGFTMRVENTSALRGTTGHIFRINGTWSEDITYYDIYLNYDPAGCFVVTNVTFDGCAGVPTSYNYDWYDGGSFLLLWAFFDPGEEIPAGGGTLCNIVINVNPETPPCTVSLDFTVGEGYTDYYNAAWELRVPEVVNGHIDILANTQPDQPAQPSGLSVGETGIPYSYSTSATDPESHQVQYRFDWGDEQFSAWTSLVPSGQAASQSHAWMYPGVYEVKAQARDEYYAVSEWSPILTVTMSGSDLWPMFHHEPSRKGYSTSPAPAINKKKWTSLPAGAIGSSPAVASGKVFVGSDNGKVYCFNAETGAELWNKSIGTSVRSSPVVVDNKVYIGSNDNKVYCLYASNGTKKWEFETSDDVHSSPTVAYGNVYVGSNDSKVYCLDASTGGFVWSFQTGGKVQSSPAVVDGRVFVGSDDNQVYCLNASDGTKLWNYTEPSWADVYISPAVAEGKVYVAPNQHPAGGRIYCLDASDGTKLWEFSISVPGLILLSSPAVAYDRIYMGGSSSAGSWSLFCLNASDGQAIWHTGIGDVESSPAVADGKVYVGSKDNKVYCLNVTNGNKIWEYTTGGKVVSSPAIAYGRVYVGSNDGKVYCFTAENNPPNTPAKPSGNETGLVMDFLTFSANTTDPEGDQVYYQWNWGGQEGSWLGPYNSGATVTTQWRWQTPGTYGVRVRAKDNPYGAVGNWSAPLNVTIVAAAPPYTPSTPTGPNNGLTGTEYSFRSSTTDPNDYRVTYGWNWTGGDSVDEWTDYYDSGQMVTVKHTWNTPGAYRIKVKALNNRYGMSNWSGEHLINITVPLVPNITIGTIKGGILQVSAEITNTGTGNATNVAWQITVKGGILGMINVSKNGTILTLAPNEMKKVVANPIFGLGQVDIVVTTSADGVAPVEQKATGTVLFIVVLGVQKTS